MPNGYVVKRCQHGRIGTEDYVIVDAYDPVYPQAGYVRYGKADPDWLGCSLVLFHDYDAAILARGLVFDCFQNQLMAGALPLVYSANIRNAEILSVLHTQESMQALQMHMIRTRQTHSPESVVILQGRMRPAEMVN